VRDPGFAETPERAASTGRPSGDLLDAGFDLRREQLRASGCSSRSSGKTHRDQRVEVADRCASARARARLSNSRHVLRIRLRWSMRA